jgi:hypothetical protein
MYILFRIGIYLGILVFLHYTYEYLKNSLTTKKTKDLVMIHQEKYQEILNELRTSQELKMSENIDNDSDGFPTDQVEFLQQSLLSIVDSEESL